MSKSEKKSRGNGPFSIAYLDANGKAHRRVVEGATRIQITDRASNKSKVYDVQKLSDTTYEQCAVGFVGERMKSFTRNSLLNKSDATILGCTDEIYDSLVNGQLWKRGEGDGKPKGGKPIDWGYWREVAIAAQKRKTGQTPSDEMLDKWVASKMDMTRKEFRKWSTEWCANPSVDAARKQIDAQRAAKHLKEVGVPDVEILV